MASVHNVHQVFGACKHHILVFEAWINTPKEHLVQVTERSLQLVQVCHQFKPEFSQKKRQAKMEMDVSKDDHHNYPTISLKLSK